MPEIPFRDLYACPSRYKSFFERSMRRWETLTIFRKAVETQIALLSWKEKAPLSKIGRQSTV